MTAQRYWLHEGPRRVLVGKERFSENCAWSEMPQHWPSRVADRAVIEVVGQGRLGVFPTEPYPADGPFLGHPRVMATAHTAALTSDYFVAASRRPGDALASYLDREPPAGLLT